MKPLCSIIAVLLFFSTNAFGDSINEETPVVVSSQEFSITPKYRDLFEKIIETQGESRKENILKFYSEVLPWLRHNAYLNNEPNYVEAYALAEDASFRLARMYLMKRDDLDENAFVFYQRIILNDAFDTAQELTLNVIPILETIDPTMKEISHAKN